MENNQNQQPSEPATGQTAHSSGRQNSAEESGADTSSQQDPDDAGGQIGKPGDKSE